MKKHSCLTPAWKKKIDKLDIAFQPIININTGRIYAVEALLREHLAIGYKSIFDVFDAVYEEDILYCFDLELRRKVFKKFTTIQEYEQMKLFYNLDNRLFNTKNFSTGNTLEILNEFNIKKENLCFEISERHELEKHSGMDKVLQHYQNENYLVAIDDFGTGYAGYKLLFDATPEVIKIDRYFLQDIQKDMKKRLMVKSITHLAIQLGIQVVAEGIETKEEYLTCKDIGCHFVQGYFVQKPTLITHEILQNYSDIVKIMKHSRRDKDTGNIKKYISKIDPIKKNNSMREILAYFKKYRENAIVPVVNDAKEPIGLFFETDIKEYLYSPYGISILSNETDMKSRLKSFVRSCPSIDINSDIETIIELFSSNTNAQGIIVTKNAKYYGFLSANNIISIMNEENIIIARDQNPLTKLPGNRVVGKYLSKVQESDKTAYILCYFDLDNFKAFNDIYGFRLGDRAIQLFADIINKNLSSKYFKGHIGGDDFFVAVRPDKKETNYTVELKNIITRFENNARELYSVEDRNRGYIISKDREAKEKHFALLSVSAAVLFVNSANKSQYKQEINLILSQLKKSAKKEPQHICLSSLL